MYKNIILVLLFTVSLYSADSKDSPIEVFKKQRSQQGELHFSKAQEYFQNRKFKASIEKVLDFLYVYPDHSQTLNAMKLLSESYLMDDQIEKSIQVDLRIHRENPMIEEGLIAYLQVAKKYVKMGKKDEAIDIFGFITKQMYSKKVAKDAEIELEQIKILDSENTVTEK
jgi:TolA-binding protein